jgi:predicted PurR-regulated permease PerM
MVDLVQVVLLTVIIILTLLLVILGIQVFRILNEVRKTVSKTNGILEKADNITESVKTPLAALSTIAIGVKSSSLLSIAKFIRSILGHEKGEGNEKQQI